MVCFTTYARLGWSASLPVPGWDGLLLCLCKAGCLLVPEKAYRMGKDNRQHCRMCTKDKSGQMVLVLDGYSALVCNRNFLRVCTVVYN